MKELVVTWIVVVIGGGIAVEVIKFVWKWLSIKVFGFKPLLLDEKQLAHTVDYCPKQYIRECKRLNPAYAGMTAEEERMFLSDMEKFTSLVVMTYLDSAK